MAGARRQAAEPRELRPAHGPARDKQRKASGGRVQLPGATMSRERSIQDSTTTPIHEAYALPTAAVPKLFGARREHRAYSPPMWAVINLFNE
jgi:hypothetical protein